MFKCLFLLFSVLVISGSLVAKELKTLVLVIDSDDKPAYKELREVWRSYSRLDPEHFEVYFIRGNPQLAADFVKEGDTLVVKTEEGFRPGILNKTILSLASFKERLKSYDYVLRTNLSSFYVWPTFLNYLSSLPRKGCYAAVALHIPEGWEPDFGYIPFGSGAGFVMSQDVAELLVSQKADLEPYSSRLPDDVAIGLFFYRHKIPLIPAERQDLSSWEEWVSIKEKRLKKPYHFRAKKYFDARKGDEDFSEELNIMNDLVSTFYKKCTKSSQ